MNECHECSFPDCKLKIVQKKSSVKKEAEDTKMSIKIYQSEKYRQNHEKKNERGFNTFKM